MNIRFLGKEFEMPKECAFSSVYVDVTAGIPGMIEYKIVPNEFIWSVFKRDIDRIGLYTGASFDIDGKKARIFKIVDLNHHVKEIYFKTILED